MAKRRKSKPAWRWRQPNDLSPGLRLAVEAVGGNMSELARALDITPQAVSLWDDIPFRRIVAIERATKVPRERLRPDLYRRRSA